MMNHSSTSRHGNRADWRSDDYCDESDHSDSRRRALERKTAQLCAQAHRELGSVIQNELMDADLSGATVLEVRPFPDAGRLLVVVLVPQDGDPDRTRDVLGAAAGRLRFALGRAISRKRVPVLVFEAVEPGGTADG